MKASYYDPNPVVILEHKGLYWSKVKGTENAKSVEPNKDYVIPLGKGRVIINAEEKNIQNGKTLAIITYGMGVYWALSAAENFPGQIEIIDLRTLHPLDEKLIYATVKTHSRCLVITEEPSENSFAQSLSGKIQENCFTNLDAPVKVLGSENVPAIPLNSILEERYLPNAEKVTNKINELMAF